MGERIRGRAGQVLRLRRLKRTNGLCEMCIAAGRVREATRVDHIRLFVLGGDDVDSNTRNLCQQQHLEVTVAQLGQQVTRDGRGNGRSGRPISPDHPWNRR